MVRFASALALISEIDSKVVCRRSVEVHPVWRERFPHEDLHRVPDSHYRDVHFLVALQYVWIKGDNFGSQPTCNHLVKYVLFIIMTACTLLFRFGAILSVHMEQLHKLTHKLKKRTKVWRVMARTETQYHEDHEDLENQKNKAVPKMFPDL